MRKLEDNFEVSFVAELGIKEKQIQQNYRPVIGVHKWFARRPGSVFRSLILSEFNGSPLRNEYWHSHHFKGIIADPFMGGGTPLFEANRLGFDVIGTDINPMAFWIVTQSMSDIDLDAFNKESEAVITDIEREIKRLYKTECQVCGGIANVKYFIWVKTQDCPHCGSENKLFPGYLLAAAERHPKHVVLCSHCNNLNEYERQPSFNDSELCATCNNSVFVEGPAKNTKIRCLSCSQVFSYPEKNPTHPPKHVMWAIEYHCDKCKPTHKGRFFKIPDPEDLKKFRKAELLLKKYEADLHIPSNEIPEGDETKRLHRWGYKYYREMFNTRQLLGLGLLLRRIRQVKSERERTALLTVFSDFLRYQNMVCRYDPYALKCQDIFSIHGYPVGLIQCENNLLGIPNVGSGAFRHFVNKYRRAKEYCKKPFETRCSGRSKKLIYILGEHISASLVNRFPDLGKSEGWITCRSAETIPLKEKSLDGVFTDPPYLANVQYAELIDFCYAWLRMALDEVPEFKSLTTRAAQELTGNESMERGIDHFTEGLSRVFFHYASALKDNAPFVFTFHHNDLKAYVPLLVAVLDAGLDCTASLPVPGEMSASLHIARTKSSVLDSVFVCRRNPSRYKSVIISDQMEKDIKDLKNAGLKLTEGDIRCILTGHMARVAINRLRHKWKKETSLSDRMAIAEKILSQIRNEIEFENLVTISLLGTQEESGAVKHAKTSPI